MIVHNTVFAQVFVVDVVHDIYLKRNGDLHVHFDSKSDEGTPEQLLSYSVSESPESSELITAAANEL